MSKERVSERMKKNYQYKLGIAVLVGTLFLTIQHTYILDSPAVSACTTTAECQNEIAEAQKKRAELAEKQKELEAKSADTKAQVENVIAQLGTYQNELTLLEVEMTNLQAQKVQLEKGIAENDQKIKQRLLMTQLSIETDEMLEFLANAHSVTEMIERLQTVNDLTASNQEMIQLLESQKQELIQNEEKQQKRKAEMNKLVEEQVKLQTAKQAELTQYQADTQNAMVLKEQVTKELGISQQQLTEIETERQKAREREQARIEAAQNAAQQNGNSQSKPVEIAPVPTTPIPSNGSAIENERVAFKYFVNQGYTRAAAAGIIGNFYVESGMDPTKKQYFGGPGRGLAQWGYGEDGNRFNDLIKWARSKGKSEWALDTQLEWTVYEMNTYSWFRKMNNALKSTNDVAYATYYFGDVFEGPANLSASINERIRYANQVYNRN